ncbi:MAG TPA: tetratricopeptide repeat protein [Verrucomicrobiae bacterium]|nr:tetratricopeptide repeat protein [Verrucomicrobiae bacterium]
MKHIFVSYDEFLGADLAEAVVETFDKYYNDKVNVYINHKNNIDNNKETFEKRILSALKESIVYILILTSKSLTRHWIKREIGEILKECKLNPSKKFVIFRHPYLKDEELKTFERETKIRISNIQWYIISDPYQLGRELERYIDGNNLINYIHQTINQNNQNISDRYSKLADENKDYDIPWNLPTVPGPINSFGKVIKIQEIVKMLNNNVRNILIKGNVEIGNSLTISQTLINYLGNEYFRNIIPLEITEDYSYSKFIEQIDDYIKIGRPEAFFYDKYKMGEKRLELINDQQIIFLIEGFEIIELKKINDSEDIINFLQRIPDKGSVIAVSKTDGITANEIGFSLIKLDKLEDKIAIEFFYSLVEAERETQSLPRTESFNENIKKLLHIIEYNPLAIIILSRLYLFSPDLKLLLDSIKKFDESANMKNCGADLVIEFILSSLDDETKNAIFLIAQFHTPFNIFMLEKIGINTVLISKILESGLIKNTRKLEHFDDVKDLELYEIMNPYITQYLSSKTELNLSNEKLIIIYDELLTKLQNSKKHPILRSMIMDLLGCENNNIEKIIKYIDNVGKKNLYEIKIAFLLYDISNFKRSSNLIRKVLNNRKENNHELLIKYNKCKSKLGESTIAINSLEKILKDNQNSLNSEQNCEIYIELATMYRDIGNHKQSFENLEKFLRFNQQGRYLSKYWYIKGTIYRNMGQFDLAIESLNRSLEITKQFDYKYYCNIVRRNIGITKWLMGQYEEAKNILADVLEEDIKIGNEIDIARDKVNLGYAKVRMEDFDEGVHDILQGIQIDKRYRLIGALARDKLILGIAYRYTGKLQLAIHSLMEGHDLNLHQQNQYGRNFAIYYMGMVKRDEGKVKNAIIILKDLELEEIKESNPLFYSGILRNIAISYKDLANLNIALNKLQSFYEKILNLCVHHLKDPSSLYNHGHRLSSENNFPVNEYLIEKPIPRNIGPWLICAEKYIKRSLQIGKDSEFLTLKDKYNLSTIYQSMGKNDEALQILQDLESQINDPVMLSRVKRHIAMDKMNRRKYDEAIVMIEESEKYAEKSQNRLHLSKVLMEHGSILFSQGEYEKAKIYLNKAELIDEDLEYKDDLLYDYLALIHLYVRLRKYKKAFSYVCLAMALLKVLDIEIDYVNFGC